MTKEETLQCPLCHGRSHVTLSDLREFANGAALQQSVEKLAASASEVLQPASVTTDNNGRRDFQKEVHSWNPELPIWRRSPKE
ncbi:MAG TPA: hypothetical protein VFA68_06460 [Terriglobales bacterium]|nr:hypothetical protein [Terriglobales bacterium]